MMGMAANQVEKKENTKPMYSFPRNAPHQRIMRLTVLNTLHRLLSADRPILSPDVGLPHLPVERAGLQKFFLPALGNDFAAFQHHDVVRISDGGQPMGDDQ